MLTKIIRVGYSLTSKHSYFPIKIPASKTNINNNSYNCSNNSNSYNSYNINSFIYYFPNAYIRTKLISLVNTSTSNRILYNKGTLVV